MLDESVHCVVTSPPYFGLRDYGVSGQIGLEKTPDAYVAELVDVFREVRRVLHKAGTLWLVIGDSYNNFRSQKGPGQTVHGRDKLNGKPAPETGSRGWGSLKEKDLIGIPWRAAFALQADGWYLRQDIIWSKPNPMPESVTDRCTKAHDYIFLLSKSERYYFDATAIEEDAVARRQQRLTAPMDHPKAKGFGGQNFVDGGISDTRNKRSVWDVATQPYPEAHFATFPPALIEPCIKAGCPVSGTVLDPFSGAGTTGLVADRLQRNAILIELNPKYAAMAKHRIVDDAGMFCEFKSP
jgi:DNA modification methylase